MQNEPLSQPKTLCTCICQRPSPFPIPLFSLLRTNGLNLVVVPQVYQSEGYARRQHLASGAVLTFSDSAGHAQAQCHARKVVTTRIVWMLVIQECCIEVHSKHDLLDYIPPSLTRALPKSV